MTKMVQRELIGEETIEDILYLARAGELDELKQIITDLATQRGTNPLEVLSVAWDPQSLCTVAHRAAANGHVDVLKWIREQMTTTTIPEIVISRSDTQVAPKGEELSGIQYSGDLFRQPNDWKSTPLHWAAMNGQLEAMKIIVDYVSDPAEKLVFLEAKDKSGHDAAFVAEQAGKQDCVNWLLGALDATERLRGLEQGNGTSTLQEEEEDVMEADVEAEVKEVDNEEAQTANGVQGVAEGVERLGLDKP